MVVSQYGSKMRPITVECMGDPARADGPFIFTCEHASRALYGREETAADSQLLDQHWGWDIGAMDVTNALVSHLDCVAVSTKFSRLIIDVNRHPKSDTLIVDECGSEVVPFNRDLTDDERSWRLRTFHKQYHDTVTRIITQRLQRGPVNLVSIHSFTPVWKNTPRQTEIGVLFDEYESDARRVADALSREGFVSALNKPYSGVEGELMYSAHRHGQHHKIPYLELEIRQDLLSSSDKIQTVALRIARALQVFEPS